MILLFIYLLQNREHQELVDLARQHGVLVSVEFHKRFDPIYSG